jgi:hypothetical protein
MRTMVAEWVLEKHRDDLGRLIARKAEHPTGQVSPAWPGYFTTRTNCRQGGAPVCERLWPSGREKPVTDRRPVSAGMRIIRARQRITSGRDTFLARFLLSNLNMKRANFRAVAGRGGFIRTTLAPVHDRRDSRFDAMDMTMFMLLIFGAVFVVRFLAGS